MMAMASLMLPVRRPMVTDGDVPDGVECHAAAAVGGSTEDLSVSQAGSEFPTVLVFIPAGRARERWDRGVSGQQSGSSRFAHINFNLNYR